MRLSITEIKSFAQFRQVATEGKVSVIDFHAVWCGPCKVIAPTFAKLAAEFAGRVQFLKVDVDQVEDVAQEYGVSAMPTFIMLNGTDKLASVRGMDPTGLAAMIAKHAPAAGAASSGGSSSAFEGFSSLNSSLELNQVSCLNEDSSHTIRDLLKGGGDKWLASDADEQLLLHLPFNQSSRIRALKFKTAASSLGQAPLNVKLFVNRPTIGFDDAESEEAAQEVTLTEAQQKGEEVVELRFVRFQNVNSLSLFVKDNKEGGDVTRLDSLEVLGAARDGTDMSQLQKGEDDHDH